MDKIVEKEREEIVAETPGLKGMIEEFCAGFTLVH